MLNILIEKRPGDRQQTTDKMKIENCHMESIWTQWQQLVTWPKCLGRGIHLTLPSSTRSVVKPPSPVPSSSSSDSSGPSSLESMTEPESGYEASISSSPDTE